MINKTTILFILLVGAGIWIIGLRRQLEAAQMRGDMYRDISTRLDRRLAEMNGQ